jgi:sporulation protein YlmC with PRC-barrel domain
MVEIAQDLVGRSVYGREGTKIGDVKETVYGGEYVVVRRSFFTSIVVPAGVLQESGGRLTIPHTASYLDNAPRIDTKRELSPRDKALLDDFYLPKAA